MARRRDAKAPAPSLFPFLSVLACVIGTLTLLLVALAIGELGGQALEGLRQAEELARQRGWIRTQETRLEELERQLERADAKANEVAELQRRLAGLGLSDDISLEELKGQVDRLAEAEALRRQKQELEDRSTLLAGREISLRKEIERNETAQARAPILIDPTGLGSDAQPYFVECSEDHLELRKTKGDWSYRILKDEITLDHDYKLFLRRVKEIDQGLVIFLIRPDGVATYRIAAELADRYRVRHARLPLPGEGKLDFGRF